MNNLLKKLISLVALHKSQNNSDSNQVDDTIDTRESMVEIGQSLPILIYLFIQQFLTEVTGKAPQHLPPLVEFTANHRQFMTLGLMAGGILLTALAMNLGWLGFPLYIIALLLISASMRTMQVSFTHYASHGTLHKNAKSNRRLGEFYSILSLSTPMWMYKLSHTGGHHGRLNSVADPDAAFFENWGYKPGQTVKSYWLWTLRLVLSPAYYAKSFWQRLKANFAPNSVSRGLVTTWPTAREVHRRQLSAIAFHSTLALVAIASGFGWLYLSAYIVPLVFGFGILSLLQNLSEHQPGKVPGQDERLRAETQFTAGRFFGKPYDSSQSLTWWLHMVFVALPSKYLVVGNTELCSHDVHHAAQRVHFTASDDNWAMAPYVRRDAVNQNAVFKENWGLKATIEHSFIPLSVRD